MRRVAVLGSLAISCGAAGGPIAGAQDTHCAGVPAQVTQAALCDAPSGDKTIDYGATRYNDEADDDDCKYHVTYSATPILQNTDVTFTVVATKKTDGTAAAGANIAGEVFLNDNHPAPNSGQQTTEVSPGTFRIGPVRFDAPGMWTVRFHLFQRCTDGDDASPHGHAAFYVSVP
jgi:hypothetical protein